MRRKQNDRVLSEKINVNIPDLQKLRHLNLGSYRLSSYVIYAAKGTREQKAKDYQNIIDKFMETINRQQIPGDISFARVISALTKLNQTDVALDLFTIMSQKVNRALRKEIIGPYTYSAILELSRKQLKNANEENKKRILARVLQWWQECSNNNCIDKYTLTNMMCIYSYLEHLDQVVELFSSYPALIDLPMYSQYVIALVKKNELDKAKVELSEMIRRYSNLKSTSKQNDNAMYCVYNYWITAYYINPQKSSEALALFESAVSAGFYSNNQYVLKDNKIRLNFHLHKNCKVREGGLPLAVAKVAFLYLVKQISQDEVHFSSQIVTGGHDTQHAKLKQEFPTYLYDEYGIEITWNENPKILEFDIPYAAMRKIRFVQDFLTYMDMDAPEIEFTELKRRYRADLRRDNEGRPFKQHSTPPALPGDFEDLTLQLANNSMQAYNNKNYGDAQQFLQQIIILKPQHPWAYVQLGWVLHRTEKMNEAIKQYQEAIQRLEANPHGDQELLSETYRKLGWAYDRIHRKTPIKKHIQAAFDYYKRAISLNPNNVEVYNNWGIGLIRLRQFHEAIKKFIIVKDKNFNHEECCVQIGNCYKFRGDNELALKYYNEAINRSQKNNNLQSAAWIYAEIGDLYFKQFRSNTSDKNLFQKSLAAFEKCLELQPSRDQALKGLALLYEISGDVEKSNEYKKQASRVLPDPNHIASTSIPRSTSRQENTHTLFANAEQSRTSFSSQNKKEPTPTNFTNTLTIQK